MGGHEAGSIIDAKLRFGKNGLNRLRARRRNPSIARAYVHACVRACVRPLAPVRTRVVCLGVGGGLGGSHGRARCQ